MKLKPKAPQPATLYVYRNSKGEIVVATFLVLVAQTMRGTHKHLKEEQHLAKSETTNGMYGKLFGLSGIQRRGALALNKTMTKAQKTARGEKAAQARWN